MRTITVDVPVDIDDVLDTLSRDERIVLARRILAEEASEIGAAPVPLEDERNRQEIWEAARSGDRYAFDFTLRRFS